MKKVIALIDRDTELQQLCKAAEGGIKPFLERAQFLRKQLKDLEDDAARTGKKHVDGIKDYLLNHKCLPNDFTDKHHIHIDIDENVIWACDGAEHRKNIAEHIASVLQMDDE